MAYVKRYVMYENVLEIVYFLTSYRMIIATLDDIHDLLDSVSAKDMYHKLLTMSINKSNSCPRHVSEIKMAL